MFMPMMNRLFVDWNRDYRKTVFLAGTERSGTTWISDIINYNNEYRYIFEPFWALKVDICKPFQSHQYLRPHNQNECFVHAAKYILSGNIRNPWTDQYHRKFFANRRLIKDVRANLFLKWAHSHFPEVPIVLLLRHPCAVARSYFGRERPYPILDKFLIQEELMEDFLNPFKQEIKNVKSDFEAFIFSWCIQNYVPLKQFKLGEIHVCFYERFCEDPENEIRGLFSFLRKPYISAVLKQIKNPSPQCFKKSAVITGGSLIDSWRDYISGDQIYRALKILYIFGLDKVYSENSMPDIEGAMELLRAN